MRASIEALRSRLHASGRECGVLAPGEPEARARDWRSAILVESCCTDPPSPARVRGALIDDFSSEPLSATEARVWVWPDSELLESAVRSGGGSVVPLARANAIVCTGDDVELLRRSLLPGVRWVQLGAAGIEMWLDAGLMQPNVVWTAAKGVYARPIAEHILALILAAARGLPERARARTWGTRGGRLLAGSTVGVVGSGGIGTELIGLLAPLGVRTIALTRDGRSVPGADLSVGPRAVAAPPRRERLRRPRQPR